MQLIDEQRNPDKCSPSSATHGMFSIYLYQICTVISPFPKTVKDGYNIIAKFLLGISCANWQPYTEHYDRRSKLAGEAERSEVTAWWS